MEITDVKVFPVEEAKLKAFVSIVIDHCFMINDIKVIQGRDGLFISMPSRRKRSGEFKDVAHPLNQGTRSWMEGCILGAYHECLGAGDVARGGMPSAELRPASAPGVAGSGLASSGLAGSGLVGGALGNGAPGNNGAGHEAPRPGATANEHDARHLVSGGGRSLEEVEREHLSDSFWSVG